MLAEVKFYYPNKRNETERRAKEEVNMYAEKRNTCKNQCHKNGCFIYILLIIKKFDYRGRLMSLNEHGQGQITTKSIFTTYSTPSTIF